MNDCSINNTPIVKVEIGLDKSNLVEVSFTVGKGIDHHTLLVQWTVDTQDEEQKRSRDMEEANTCLR